MENIPSRENYSPPSVAQEPEITFADLGIKPREVVRESAFGKLRSVSSLTNKEWVFLAVSILSVLTCVGITIQRLCVLPHNSEDSTLAIILLFNSGVSLFYIIHASLFERPYELVVFLLASVIVMLYCIIEYSVNTDGRNNIKLARLIVVVTLAPVTIMLGYFITKEYYESGNLIFRTVGANSALQSACWTLFLYEDLLKFDFQLAISMVIMILKGTFQISELEQWIIGIGVPVSVLWLIFAFSVVRFESIYILGSCVITGFAQPAYVIYRIILSTQNIKNGLSWDLPSFVFAGGILSLCLRTLVLVLLVTKVRSNFGKGLREKVYGEQACCVETAEDNLTTSVVSE